MVDLGRGTASGSTGTTNHHIALGHGVDVAIGTLERRHHQSAAAQTLGIAHGRDRHIDLLARLGKGRQGRGNHHRRHVAQLQRLVGRQGHPQLGKHVDDALHGKGRLGSLVATAIEANHQTVPDQLVVTDALNAGQILDPLSLGGGRH